MPDNTTMEDKRKGILLGGAVLTLVGVSSLLIASSSSLFDLPAVSTRLEDVVLDTSSSLLNWDANACEELKASSDTRHGMVALSSNIWHIFTCKRGTYFRGTLELGHLLAHYNLLQLSCDKIKNLLVTGGKYNHLSACADCSEGQFSDHEHSHGEACEYCPDGYYQDRLGGYECKQCSPGSYCKKEKVRKRTDLCAKSHDDGDEHECDFDSISVTALCPAGWFQDERAQTACKPCNNKGVGVPDGPEKRYRHQEGFAFCARCKDNFVAAEPNNGGFTSCEAKPEPAADAEED